MNNTLNQSQIKVLKELSEDSIRKTNIFISDLLKGYNFYSNSKIVKKLDSKGLSHDDRYLLIALSYHRYLNGLDLKLAEQYIYFDSLHIEQEKRYQEALKRDSVNGIYIPSNLEDCFIELDKILSAEDKEYIKKNGANRLHMTLGLQIRNSWQLWGGSRLKKYFLDMTGGFIHVDRMSGIILHYYDKWLKGDKDAWKEWENKMKKKK